MSQADTDGFTIVKAKSRRSHITKLTPHTTHAKGGFYSTSQTTRKALQLANPSVERFVHEINSKQNTLTKSKFCTLLEPAIHAICEFAPEEIVCYGIGTLRLPVSQWQLALILLLNSQNAPIHAFDPVATEDDAHILCHFGITPIVDNEMGKRQATKRTLFYMPHCEQFLYENTVSANWSSTLLGHTMIVGNHFSRYQEAQADEFAQQSPHIKHMLPHTTVVEMPHESTLGLRHCPYAFSDMCIQHIK
ncbi:hypothetical protein IW141_003902 [Coemansia sp. RSA 355]|nr:hypothetical protein IW141_003902 [Coemansia sp. RSA 355]